MEIFFLMSIIGLIGLAVSTGMLCAMHSPDTKPSNDFDHKGRDKFFNRLKINAARLK